MAIDQGDIKLMRSQVMLDVPEGGGTSSGVEIQSGASNAIFEDISDADRAGGRVNLRKIHLHIQSLDNDTYLGSNVIIAQPPNDPNVDISLFRASDAFDRNQKAKTTLESYYQKGPVWGGYLYGNHIAGMKAVTIIQREIVDLPTTGKTLCLVYDEGKVTQREQYIRILDVSTKLMSFVDGVVSGQDQLFWRNVVTLELSDALRYDFPGIDAPNRIDNYKNDDISTVRDTTVANAVTVYGCKPLSEAAGVGSFKAKVDGIFSQIAPAATSEIPLLAQSFGKEVATMMQAGPEWTESRAMPAFGPGTMAFLPTGVLPGSLSISRGGLQITDSAGAIIVSGVERGTIDYATGRVDFGGTMPTSVAGNATVSYIPAAEVVQIGHTNAIDITAETRRRTFAERIKPIPAPGSLTLAFQAMGVWYVLKDNGAGVLAGSSPENGAGTISYVTGDMLATTGALPDVGSQVILSWASPAHYQIRTAEPIPTPTMEIDIGAAVFGGTGGDALEIAWTSGGQPKSATWNGTAFTGDATGLLDQTSGKARITTSSYPDPHTSFTVTGTSPTGGGSTKIKTGVAATGGIATFSVGEAIEPGTLVCEWSCDSTVKWDSETVTTRLTIGMGCV